MWAGVQVFSLEFASAVHRNIRFMVRGKRFGTPIVMPMAVRVQMVWYWFAPTFKNVRFYIHV